MPKQSLSDALLLTWLGPFFLGHRFGAKPWFRGVKQSYSSKLGGVLILLWAEALLVAGLATALLPRPSQDLETEVVAVGVVVTIFQMWWLGGKTGDSYIRRFRTLPMRSRVGYALASATLFVVPGVYFFVATTGRS